MKHPRRSRKANAGLICAAVIITACSEPTAPEAPGLEAPGLEAPDSITPGSRAHAQPIVLSREPGAVPAASAVQDATDRVAASLAHPDQAVLRRTLHELAGALSQPDRERSIRLLAQARRVLRDLGSSRKAAEIGPELSAIDLALDAAQREVEAPNVGAS